MKPESQNFVNNDLSNWYLRLIRKRLLEKDQIVYNIIYYVIDIVNRLMAPYVPFIVEKVFLEMQEHFDYAKGYKSVHLMDYPIHTEDFLNDELIDEMEFIVDLIQDLRGLREQVRIKTRQPIKEYLMSIQENMTYSMFYQFLFPKKQHHTLH